MDYSLSLVTALLQKNQKAAPTQTLKRRNIHQNIKKFTKPKIMSAFKKYKKYILVALVYLLFLAALPQITSQAVPCVHQISSGPFEYSNCNLPNVMNHFILFEFIGLIISFITMLCLDKKIKSEQLLVLGVLSLIAVAYFYLYLPVADTAVLNSAIFLDTFHDQYSI